MESWRGLGRSQMEAWRLTIEPRPGSDPHQNEKSDPDTPEREKIDPDTHQIDEDSQKRCKCSKKTENVSI